jgi:O-acetyl-ADP-ribose deacetylase (regulator of RNase III)
VSLWHIQVPRSTNMIHEINANLLEEPLDGIIHQANCMHIMGGGIALRIRNKWPEAYEADLKTPKSDPKKLGTFSVAILPSNFHIFNMYSQFGIGFKRETNYTAVVEGLEKIRDFAIENGLTKLGLPKYMGCRLGGGHWPVVRAIIEEVFEASPEGDKLDLVICNYDK